MTKGIPDVVKLVKRKGSYHVFPRLKKYRRDCGKENENFNIRGRITHTLS